MTVRIADLVPQSIAAIQPYEPGKPIEEVERELGVRDVIKLASNENPLGPSPKGMAEVARALEKVALYPDGASFYLRRKLSNKLGVSVGEIAVGNGSNELLDLIVRTFTRPGDEVLAPAQTFVCYMLAAMAHGALYKEAPRRDGFRYDVDALLAAVTPKTRVVFIANPDNPTGVYATEGEMRRLLRELREDIVLVVDEAYIEYARAADYPDMLRHRAERQLLVSLRTFSKIYGLAGTRCGYAIAPAEIVAFLDRVRNPFNVSSLAQAAAIGALDDDDHVTRARTTNERGMAQLEAGLAKLGLAFTPSQANFVLVDVGARDGRQVYSQLLAKGVIVRPLGGYRLPHHLRVTVGTEAENARLLAALEPLVRA